MTPEWMPVEWAECDACGSGDVEAYTTAGEGYVYDGDPLRCVDCGATSSVHADSESGPWAGDWTNSGEGFA